MKTVPPFIIILLLSLFFGCSDNPLDLEKKSVNNVSGTYRLSGQQINLEVCYGPSNYCDYGDILSRDTIQTSFEMEIDIVKSKQDTIRIYGLEGAGSGVQNADFAGRAAVEECSLDEDCPYVKLTGETIEFDLTYWQYRYYGTGTFVDGKLTLDTHYRYRGDGVDYILKGEKTE